MNLHGLSSSESNITLYAEVNDAEDWAESFMYYNADKMYGYLVETSDGRKLGFADLYPNKAKIINEWMESKN
jgi:1,2-phenylacetyl-CoA epoxidase PaaB subunit